MSDQTTTDDGFEPIEVIFAGRRLDKDDKPFVVFYAVTGTDDFSFQSKDAMKRFRHAIIGGVYRFQRNDRSFRLHNDWQRGSDDARVPEWRTLDQSVDVELRAKKRMAEEREKAKDSVATLLAPIRKEYQKTDYVGRLAIEVVVLAALRRGL